MATIKLKRAYEPEETSDGFRVYIDRLWPRGLSHETFHYDLWDKEIAPSTELREWFHGTHDDSHAEAAAEMLEKWPEFEKRYAAELKANPAFAALKEQLSGKPVVTLLYSSHDQEHNNAVVVAQMLEEGK